MTLHQELQMTKVTLHIIQMSWTNIVSLLAQLSMIFMKSTLTQGYEISKRNDHRYPEEFFYDCVSVRKIN